MRKVGVLLRGPGGYVVVVGGAVGYVLCAVAATFAVVRRPLIDRQADLNVYYGAVHAVGHGAPLYSYAAANGDPFTYPPFAVLVLWPIGWVQEQTLRVVWTLFTCVAVLALAWCVVRAVSERGRAAALWATGLVLLVSAPLQSNLRFGQVSVFVILLAFADVSGLVPRRWRGVLVGVAAAIKLTPLLFIGYLLVTGQRRATAVAAATFTACGVLAAAVLAADSWTFWTHAIVATSRVGDLASTGNQSLNGMLLRLPLLPTHREAAWLLASAVVCAAALYRAAALCRSERLLEAAVTIGCATLAISPVSWTHHQIWTVLAALLLLARPTVLRTAAAVIVLALMTFRLPGAGPLGMLAVDARGICTVAVCCVGLATAWRAARTPVLTLAGRIPLRPQALAVTGAAGLLLSGMLVVTGLIHVAFLNPTGFTSTRWQLAMQGTGAAQATAAISYTAAYSSGHWTKAVGVVAASVTHLEVKVTPTGPTYTVPLFPDSRPGTRVFALITNSGAMLTLTAYDTFNHALSPSTPPITATSDSSGHPLDAGCL